MAQYIDKDTLVVEIEKRRNKYFNSGGSPSSEYCHEDNEILGIIDTLEVKEVQEEPVSSIWHDASEEPKPNMELICIGQYGNPLVLSSNSNSFKERDISKWAYFNDLLNISNVQRTVEDCKEEPVSEDLEQAAIDYCSGNKGVDARVRAGFIMGAKWHKEQMMAKAIDAELDDVCGFLTISIPYHNGIVGDKVKVIVIKED